VRGRDRLLAQARGTTALARRTEHTLEVLELGDAVEALASAIRSAGITRRAELVVSISDDLSVIADRTELDQVMLNIIKNSIDALPEGRGQVSVGVRQHAGNAVITIADTGTGIEQADLAKVFEPYFTTKPPTSGTGLGLPVARQIIAGYGGTIAIASKVGVGTCVTIELPAVSLDPVPTRAPADTLSP